jgi:citrate lyase subunit beta/citryl-CoA lyase
VGISRSLIFIPGNNPRFLEKSKYIDADTICFDLEDSVPFDQKENARNLVKKTIQEIDAANDNNKKRTISVRINSIDSGLAIDDLKKVITKGLDAIPKVNEGNEVIKLCNTLDILEKDNNIASNLLKLMPSIESASGVINAYSIAKSSKRNTAIIFGIFDYLHDMKIDSYDDDFLSSHIYGRAKVPVDCRAAGIDSIDSIWQNVKDTEGLLKDCVNGKKLGYNGKCIIHPSQIDTVNKVFSPSDQDIDWARKVVSALDKSVSVGKSKAGATSIDGKMIDAVHYKQAKRILETSNKNDQY